MSEADTGPDINDAFDAIVLSEESIRLSEYEKGFAKGEADGLKEGYHLGYHRGSEIGCEVGFYRGIVTSLLDHWRQTEEVQSARVTAVTNKLISALDALPAKNEKESAILETVENARASFKQLMSLLKLPLTPPSVSSSSF